MGREWTLASHVRKCPNLGWLVNARVALIENEIPMSSSKPNASDAVLRYQQIQPRLPTATFPVQSVYRENLAALADDIDCFVLDGFGVLNVGDDTVPGAVDRVNQLRAMGKQVRVLTNGASFPATKTCAKYRNWGMEFDLAEVISSRDALAVELSNHQHMRWGFSALPTSELERLATDSVLLEDDATAYDSCDGFVLLGVGQWTADRQSLLEQSLAKKPRPVFVGNPDLVAPHPGRLSQEPGWFAHRLEDENLATPQFFGKPFDNAFALVRETLGGVDPQRIAMVGDTLHTDILGGAQAGWKTVLVTEHGLLKGMDVEKAITDSGIRPDYIIPTT